MDPIFSAKELLEFEQRTKTLWAVLPQFIEEYEIAARMKREKFKALTKKDSQKRKQWKLL